MNAAQAIMRQRKIKWYEHSKKKMRLRRKQRKRVRTAIASNLEIIFTPKTCDCKQTWDPRRMQLSVKRNVSITPQPKTTQEPTQEPTQNNRQLNPVLERATIRIKFEYIQSNQKSVYKLTFD